MSTSLIASVCHYTYTYKHASDEATIAATKTCLRAAARVHIPYMILIRERGDGDGDTDGDDRTLQPK